METLSTERPAVFGAVDEQDTWDEIRRHVAELVASGAVIPTEWYETYRPLMVTPLPVGPQTVYVRARVERVLRTLGKLEQIKGTWARRPLKLFDWQVCYEIAPVFGLVDVTTGNRIARTAYIEKPRKNGKALAPETPIVTPSGWRTMADLALGDLVFGADGRPTMVVGVAEWTGRPRWRVRFDDGDEIIADDAHEWRIRVWGDRRTVETWKLAELVDGSGSPSIDLADALQFDANSPLDPWLFGVWLGDGHTAEGRITSADPEVWDEIRRRGWKVSEPPPSAPLTRTVYGLRTQLREFGVLGSKHLPTWAQTACEADRRAMLGGIVDADGHITPAGQCEVTLTCKPLADAVVELARSLSLKPRVSESDAMIAGRVVGRRWRICFHPMHRMGVVSRKWDRVKNCRGRSGRRHVVAVERVESGPTKCIAVDNDSHLFLAGRSMTPTHNSTECSGLGIYLAFADGEEGAEVYAAAKNKTQARIVFEPAKVMAERCPELVKKLTRRGITKNALHNPTTTSVFRPLAADQGGNLHGLNVHGGVIDELHVHDTPDTVDAIETGTGSREQPLIVIITTADEGKTGSIYDTKRTYVENLCSGTSVDPSFYAVVFAATEEQLATAPFALDTLRTANPGIGYTVTEEYLVGKAREAAQSPTQLNRYLRLHLGKRTKQSVAWLLMDRWDAAAGQVDRPDFAGKVAWVGLDLSATSDFTAAVWLAPIDDTGERDGFLMWARVWIPEEQVEHLEQQTAVPLREWIKAGWITTTEGNVVDYAKVREDIAAETDRLGCTVAEVAYDPWNAAETVQKLEEAGHTMIPLIQGFRSLSSPAKELERLVHGSTPENPLLRHGGNPVLRWMADCAEVMQDPAGNIKPAKPDRRKSAKRIDGIAATVNAMSRAMLRSVPKQRRRGGGST